MKLEAECLEIFRQSRREVRCVTAQNIFKNVVFILAKQFVIDTDFESKDYQKYTLNIKPMTMTESKVLDIIFLSLLKFQLEVYCRYVYRNTHITRFKKQSTISCQSSTGGFGYYQCIILSHRNIKLKASSINVKMSTLISLSISI